MAGKAKKEPPAFEPDYEAQLFEPSRRKMGRPSDMTPAVRKAIITALMEGASYDEAATEAGIHKRTLSFWRTRGARAKVGGKDSDYRVFFQQTEHAKHRGKRRIVGCVYRAGAVDPKIALKILERRYPEEWRQRFEVEDVTPDQVDSARALLESRLSTIEKRITAGEGTLLPDSPAARADREADADNDGAGL